MRKKSIYYPMLQWKKDLNTFLRLRDPSTRTSTCCFGMQELDDHDHFGKKRLVLAGPLLSNLFCMLFRKSTKDVFHYLQKVCTDVSRSAIVIWFLSSVLRLITKSTLLLQSNTRLLPTASITLWPLAIGLSKEVYVVEGWCLSGAQLIYLCIHIRHCNTLLGREGKLLSLNNFTLILLPHLCQRCLDRCMHDPANLVKTLKKLRRKVRKYRLCKISKRSYSLFLLHIQQLNDAPFIIQSPPPSSLMPLFSHRTCFFLNKMLILDNEERSANSGLHQCTPDDFDDTRRVGELSSSTNWRRTRGKWQWIWSSHTASAGIHAHNWTHCDSEIHPVWFLASVPVLSHSQITTK